VTDDEIMERIERLVAEEHDLERRGEAEGGLQSSEHARFQEVGVSLDRLWDLLRQRRARRRAGLDPDDAALRDSDTVEDYLQ
jgi:Protein of unknown function (DUF2630)